METLNQAPQVDPSLINSEMIPGVDMGKDQIAQDTYDASALVGNVISSTLFDTGDNTASTKDLQGVGTAYSVTRSFYNENNPGEAPSLSIRYEDVEPRDGGTPSSMAEILLNGAGEVTVVHASTNDGTENKPWELSTRDAINIASESIASVKAAKEQRRQQASHDQLAA
jgi:hypothetical protein